MNETRHKWLVIEGSAYPSIRSQHARKSVAENYAKDARRFTARTIRVMSRDEYEKERGMKQNPQRLPRPVSINDTEIHTWFERDRQHVELRDKHTDKTLVEWWDDDVSQAVEDGFLDPRDYHQSAWEYYRDTIAPQDRRPRMKKNPLKVKNIGSNMTSVTMNVPGVGDTEVLFSYETPVAAYNVNFIDHFGGAFIRTEKKWSVTTSKHINKWLDGANAKHVPQEILDNLETGVMKKNPHQRRDTVPGYGRYASRSGHGFSVGDRVEMQPWTDLWMRGARYGEVIAVVGSKVHVQLDKKKKPIAVAPGNIKLVETKTNPRKRVPYLATKAGKARSKKLISAAQRRARALFVKRVKAGAFRNFMGRNVKRNPRKKISRRKVRVAIKRGIYPTASQQRQMAKRPRRNPSRGVVLRCILQPWRAKGDWWLHTTGQCLTDEKRYAKRFTSDKAALHYAQEIKRGLVGTGVEKVVTERA